MAVVITGSPPLPPLSAGRPQVGFRPVTARILDGKAVAGQIRSEVAERVARSPSVA